MTVFTRLLTLTVAFAALLVLVEAHNEKENCATNEFWYEAKETCLPFGGPAANGTLVVPPKSRSCPPSGFYWSMNLGCCVPTQPLSNDANSPPPQCQVGWHWFPALHVCLLSTPDRTTPSHASASPSSHPSSVPTGTHRKKLAPRKHKKRAVSLCPKGLDACPIKGAIGGAYECLNVLYELKSCGGCVSIGQGQDCTTIKGARDVGCNQGRCAVYSCSAGYLISADGPACVPVGI